ncbi:hypothetical protein FHR36_007414 [Kitasatospora paracochleata]|uniref:Uncharacterized protein n=1 Tax=Kitasatospora paracochleata TaxID=58354 RepID=A0ABT1J9T1_9ACTN|nr:hypothetical protein [Kitasatospora paracochleata]
MAPHLRHRSAARRHRAALPGDTSVQPRDNTALHSAAPGPRLRDSCSARACCTRCTLAPGAALSGTAGPGPCCRPGPGGGADRRRRRPGARLNGAASCEVSCRTPCRTPIQVSCGHLMICHGSVSPQVRAHVERVGNADNPFSLVLVGVVGWSVRGSRLRRAVGLFASGGAVRGLRGRPGLLACGASGGAGRVVQGRRPPPARSGLVERPVSNPSSARHALGPGAARAFGPKRPQSRQQPPRAGPAASRTHRPARTPRGPPSRPSTPSPRCATSAMPAPGPWRRGTETGAQETPSWTVLLRRECGRGLAWW